MCIPGDDLQGLRAPERALARGEVLGLQGLGPLVLGLVEDVLRPARTDRLLVAAPDDVPDLAGLCDRGLREVRHQAEGGGSGRAAAEQPGGRALAVAHAAGVGEVGDGAVGELIRPVDGETADELELACLVAACPE